jgi:hypothetical protein
MVAGQKRGGGGRALVIGWERPSGVVQQKYRGWEENRGERVAEASGGVSQGLSLLEYIINMSPL